MNKKKIIPIIIVISILVAAILFFDIFRKNLEDTSKIEGSGTIEVTEIDVSSKIAGRIVDIPKEEGEKVKKGDLLVQIKYDELDAQRLSIVANLSNAKKNFQRFSKLFKTGAVAKKDYDAVVTAYRVARANYEQINASIGNAVIVSPIDGYILEKNLEVGEMAFPGSPVITIANLSKIWIKIYVNEKKIGLIKLGQKAYVKVDSFEDKEFPGKVIAISNKAEFTPKTIQTKDERVKLMFGVKIAVDNKELSLKPGMPADAWIALEEKK